MDLPGRSPAWTPFAVEAQRSVLRVTYSDAGGMDALAAATAGNYRLHASGGDGTFGDGNEYEAAGPSSVDFDAAAGVAALHFDAPLAD